MLVALWHLEICYCRKTNSKSFKLNNLGSFLNYEYKVKFKQNDNINNKRQYN